MSRSEPTSSANPAQRFFEYSAKQGAVSYYDKAKEEKVYVDMPFRFLYLDSVYQAGGGKKVGRGKDQEFIGYFSNAVRNLKEQPFTVRSKTGIVAEGLYEDVKKESGVKLIVGLYIAYYDDDKNLQIGYLKLKGSAMGEWWDFCKGKKIEEGAITLSRGEEQTDEEGKSYYYPAFTQKLELKPETEQKAIEMDIELQAYLRSYFANNGKQEDEPVFSGQAKAAAAGDDGWDSRPMPDAPPDDTIGAVDDDIPW